MLIFHARPMPDAGRSEWVERLGTMLAMVDIEAMPMAEDWRI